MMTGLTATLSGGAVLHRPALRPRGRPIVTFELLIAAAWILVLWWTVAGAGSSGPAVPSTGATAPMPSMPGMAAMPGMTAAAPGSAAHAAVLGIPMWVVMAVAMMLPGALPALVHVSTHSFRRRRGRAMTGFALVYIGVWTMFGAVALALTAVIHVAAELEVGLALALAAAWQLTVLKRHALRDCHLSVRLPPRGWAAHAGVVRFGLVNAGACVRSCWPVMLTMALVPGSQMWLWMPALSGLVWAERFARRPRRATRTVAAALTVAAVAVLAVALV